jgi:hypothetical protein
MSSSRLREPWRSFLHALDQELREPTELHCFGGFVIAEQYDLTRSTGDIDILESRGTDLGTISRLAGKGSPLHRRYRVYVDVVGVATVPEGYESRLTTIFANGFRFLGMRTLERHDLVLAKLERNSDRDREDLQMIARGPGLDVSVLKSRYERELRPLLGRPGREDATLSLWIAIIQEVNKDRATRRPGVG